MTCTSLAVYGFIDRRLLRRVERAGIAFESDCVRDRLAAGGDGAPVLRRRPDGDTRDSSPTDTDADDTDGSTNVFDVDDDAYLSYMRTLDPTDPKQQDHYRVLGLSRLRYAATEAQIRRAHRQKVLIHHPDKRRARGQQVKSDQEDYFACITRALEQLSNPSKRRAYDSVDPTFDERTPTQTDIAADKSNFYTLFTPAFDRNARWSVNMPVPALGDRNSDRSHVEAFYAFWFDFSSWREFSYLDEEDVDKGENREERRWLEKQNMAARKDRRRTEVKRIRTMVELAYANDPRVAHFRECDRAHKQREKDEKRAEKEAKRMAEETARREAEEAERARLEREAEQRRAAAAEERRRFKVQSRQFKAERDRLYDFVRTHDYFGRPASDRARMGERVELICTAADGDPERLAAVNATLREPEEPLDAAEAAGRFDAAVQQTEALLAARRKELEEQQRRAAEQAAASHAEVTSAGWTTDQTQLLVKAVQLFPAGTKNRWDVIAQYVNQHAHDDCGRPKTGKDVVQRVKALQKIEEARATAGSQQRLVAGKKSSSAADRLTAEPTARDVPNGTEVDNNDEDRPWTAEEQRRLEQALRTYPASEQERWDKVAAQVPGRSKKQCVARFKELRDQVKAKREAQKKTEAGGKVQSKKENVHP